MSNDLDNSKRKQLSKEDIFQNASNIDNYKSYCSNLNLNEELNLENQFFDKCLNLSDNEYLKNINYLDKSSNSSLLATSNKISSSKSFTFEDLDEEEENLLVEDLFSVNSDRPKNNRGLKITLEIATAKTVVNESKQRFIVYTILLKKMYGFETQPGIIEKRYSDFFEFFNLLKKKFPFFFESFSFPKKNLTGNFLITVITERKTSFQQLLSFCLSVKELRTSNIFLNFILYNEFKECRRIIRNNLFDEGIIYLENLYFILSKLIIIENLKFLRINLFITLCTLTSCLNEIENFHEAYLYSEKAFDLIKNSNDLDRNELIVPFLLLSIQLNSRVSKCYQSQNQKLLNLNENGIKYEKRESLMQLLIQKNHFILF